MAAPNFEQFHTVSIDFEVFKALTAKLESPTDTYNSVLRRVLGLSALKSRAAESGRESDPEKREWRRDGAVFAYGTEFRATYKGTMYYARVQDGGLVLNGVKHYSPSSAAMAITKNPVNGWRFWQCRMNGGDWVWIDKLRRK
jgi:hypothetical protein